MSRAVVRLRFRTELQNFLASLPTPVPFYETINENQLPTDDLWVTMDFESNFQDPTCYSRKERQEHGTVGIAVFAKAGTGDLAAVQLADLIEDHFIDPAVDLTPVNVDAVQSASEFTNGDVPRFYGVEVNIDYTNFIA